MWRHVLRHAHWTKRIEMITAHYVRQIFDLPPGSDVLPVNLLTALCRLTVADRVTSTSPFTFVTETSPTGAGWPRIPRTASRPFLSLSEG